MRSREKRTDMMETGAANESLQNSREPGGVAVWEAPEGDVARVQATCLG